MNAITEVAARKRQKRVVSVEQVKPEVAEAEAALQEFVTANAAKNAWARREREAKQALEEAMVKAGIDRLVAETDEGLREAVIAPGEKVEIDLDTLYKMVDLPTFLSVVKATQTDVKNKCGSIVLSKVKKIVETDPALSIKKVS